jgi:hypothetical protein
VAKNPMISVRRHTEEREDLMKMEAENIQFHSQKPRNVDN